MPSVLVDTSLLIDHIRRTEKESSPYLKLIREGYDTCISILTHTELYSGKSVWERRSAREEVEDLLSKIEIIPLSVAISMDAGRLSADLDMPRIDAVIAATALHHTLPLATLNRKDFEGIEGLNLLPVS